MSCPWCKDGVCRNDGDESTCDFKSLPKEVVAIRARMDSENEKAIELMRAKYEDWESYRVAKEQVRDLMAGIKIMKDALELDLKSYYVFNKQMEMTKVLIDFIAKGKRLQRKGG